MTLNLHCVDLTINSIATNKHSWVFPWLLSSKESTSNAGDTGLIPGWGRSPGGQHANPLQCSYLGNPKDRGASWATVHRITELNRTEVIELLLLKLSHFSCVRLCATLWMAVHQAPPSLGFSRPEHWSGLPFPSPMHESESKISQSCLTLGDSMDWSLPGPSVCGIFQARVLEWGAIAFSEVIEQAHTSAFSV